MMEKNKRLIECIVGEYKVLEKINFIVIQESEKDLYELENLLNGLKKKYVMTEVYDMFKGITFYILIENEELKEVKGLKNVIEVKKELLINYVNMLLKDIEYWDIENLYYKVNFLEKKSTENVKNLIKNYKKEVGGYKFLNYKNKKNYVAGMIFIKALKSYFIKIEIDNINKIYEKEGMCKLLIKKIEEYIEYNMYGKVEEEKEKLLMLQILSELYTEEFLSYNGFFLIEKKIMKLIEKVNKKIERKMKDVKKTKKDIYLEVIEYLIKKILVDISKAADGIVVTETQTNIITKIKKKKVNLDKHVYDDEIVSIFKICEEVICGYFRIKKVYDLITIKTEDKFTTSMVIDKRMTKHYIPLEKNQILEKFLIITNGIFFVKPKSWINNVEIENYSGGYIFNEIFKIKALVTRKINNFTEIKLEKGSNMIQTINALQKQEYEIDPILREIFKSLDGELWNTEIAKYMGVKSDKLKKIFSMTNEFWKKNNKELVESVLKSAYKKKTKNNKYMQKYFVLNYMKNLIIKMDKIKFYYCVFLDYRGRIYYSSGYNIQLSKFLRQFIIATNNDSKVNTNSLYEKLSKKIDENRIFEKKIDESKGKDFQLYIKNYLIREKCMVLLLNEDWDKLKLNCVYLRAHCGVMRKMLTTNMPYFFYVDVRTSGLQIFTFLVWLNDIIKLYVQKGFDFYLYRFNMYIDWLNKKQWKKSKVVDLDDIELKQFENKLSELDIKEKRQLFKKISMITIYGAGSKTLKKNIWETLNEIEWTMNEKKFYAYSVINFIEQDFLYVFLKKFKELLKVHVYESNEFKLNFGDMMINLKLNTIKEEKKIKWLFGKKISYVEKKVLNELNYEEMSKAYFVNGIHMIDACLCRSIVDIYLKHDECIVTIHDSFGVSYNQIEEIKKHYLRSFFSYNKGLKLSKLYSVLKIATYKEIENKVKEKEIKDVIDVFPEFFMKTETEIKNLNLTNLEFLLQHNDEKNKRYWDVFRSLFKVEEGDNMEEFYKVLMLSENKVYLENLLNNFVKLEDDLF